jgi:hypothetical protein
MEGGGFSKEILVVVRAYIDESAGQYKTFALGCAIAKGTEWTWGKSRLEKMPRTQEPRTETRWKKVYITVSCKRLRESPLRI